MPLNKKTKPNLYAEEAHVVTFIGKGHGKTVVDL